MSDDIYYQAHTYDEETVPVRVGIIGWPVGHSLSPRMHQAAFVALNLPYYEYLVLPVHAEALPDAVRGIRGLGFRGVNVTIPHKEAVIGLLDAVSPDAKAAGAVNTIVNERAHYGSRLIGYNTDCVGFLESLKECAFDPDGCRAIVLGAGGAARAVTYALLQCGASVTVANRRPQRAKDLATHFAVELDRNIEVLPLGSAADLSGAIARSDLLVNCTSVGMVPHVDEDPLPAAIAIPRGLFVYDLVYAPRETRLMKRAKNAGARVANGLGMLVHQGAEAFRLWTGREPPIEVMRKAIE